MIRLEYSHFPANSNRRIRPEDSPQYAHNAAAPAAHFFAVATASDHRPTTNAQGLAGRGALSLFTPIPLHAHVVPDPAHAYGVLHSFHPISIAIHSHRLVLAFLMTIPPITPAATAIPPAIANPIRPSLLTLSSIKLCKL